MLRVGPPYRNAAIAADPLGHVCEVMLEPTLPLGKHLPATLVPVQRVEISNAGTWIRKKEVFLDRKTN